jgi:hypothetical protein
MVGESAARPSGDHRRRRTARRLFLAAAALLATAAFLIGTPFLLLAIGHVRPNDWTRFSNEGQAYGGIAAVIGMLALLGVAASLVLQSRDGAANRELAQRTIQGDLLSRALDDRELLACWGPSRHGDDQQDRQHIYTNLIVSFWRSMFEIGKITEDQLRVLSARMFAGAPGRRYWTIAGPHQESHYVTDRDRKFVQILDQEHAKATVSTHTAESPKPEGAQSTLGGDHSTIAALALGIAVGAVLSGAVAVARHRSNRTS